MTSQLSLPGIDPAAIPTDRLFFALFPDTDVALSIAQSARGLRKELGLNGRFLATERLHISLHHVGDFVGLPKETAATASWAASAVATVVPPFDVAFNRTVSFVGRPGSHPFVMCGSDGVAALTEFHHVLGEAMESAGLNIRKSHFTPHITLAYSEHRIAEQRIAPVCWTVREFVLVRSLLGRRRYESLAHWRLAARDQSARSPS